MYDKFRITLEITTEDESKSCAAVIKYDSLEGAKSRIHKEIMAAMKRANMFGLVHVDYLCEKYGNYYDHDEGWFFVNTTNDTIKFVEME